ncbi:MAG: type II toxin-antitoxin system RelE/ParE family toxin [Nodosilinea sp.]
MDSNDKPLVWLHGQVKTPPFSQSARLEAVFLRRRLKQGEALSLPQSRPMPSIGVRCHELRIRDAEQNWRIIYRMEDDAILILEVFSKKSQTTPKPMIEICQQRLKQYERDRQE